ncbi:unnamed protein product, partial [Discosporangium mesarthrocarpum]
FLCPIPIPHPNPIPLFLRGKKKVLRFYTHVFKTAQMEKDCIIMSLVYIERVLTETAGKMRISQSNWRQ